MKIGILQTGHIAPALMQDFDSYPDMFVSLLSGHGFDFQSWAVVDDQFPASINDADGWLITGSKHGAYEDFPWIARLEGFLRDAYKAAVPIVGICFGHQVLAQALGGKVEKYSGGWSVGNTDYKLDGAPEGVSLMAWHQDQVTELPDDAKVIGASDFCENAMLVYSDKALSIQPHPEFRPKFVSSLIEARGRGVVPDPLLDKATETVNADLSDQYIADKMAAFFKQPRGGK